MAEPVQRSRSVYIGNLPWDVKEEELKKIFSQVGTILSLRMPIDPESGRSRGFAFCEFKEQESVQVAIKHFSGYELNGRKIRVDSAANNPDKDSRPAPIAVEAQYGEPCDPVKAPEVIASAVGKLSPHLVQSIIADAKRCLLADPEEARTALVNNPQLTYALLLALVKGKYITKERGTEAMIKPDGPVLPLFPEARSSIPQAAAFIPPPVHDLGRFGQPVAGVPPVVPGAPRGVPIPAAGAGSFPAPVPPTSGRFDYGGRQQDFGGRSPGDPRRHDSRRHDGSFFDRNAGGRGFPPASVPPHISPAAAPSASPGSASPSTVASQEEKEKAELIMQVLKLREEDIAKMAPEQQRTVRMLREQFKGIAK